MEKSWKIFKKLHRWPGLVLSFILLYFAVTGIVMNHRDWFSGVDVDRKYLPEEYAYQNWNNSAVKGNLNLNADSVLLYGNIGIWLTDSAFTRYQPFDVGLPNGSDNRKIFDIHRTPDGALYAATLFGLYGYHYPSKQWKKFNLPVDIERFTAVESIGDTVYAINRSHLFKGKSAGTETSFVQIELPVPAGYVNKVSLFATLWQIHSGEILGLPGQLFVDLLGLVTIFLSVTGIIYFFIPGWMKRRNQKNLPVAQLARTGRWNLKWHNKVGALTFLFLILLYFTGMFLRPPLLIAIATTEVAPLKYSHLDQPNPWYDKLRDILYDPTSDRLLLSTAEGIYWLKPNGLQPVRFENQPPVSVMGINVFQHYSDGTFLVGSFSGLFLWHPDSPEVVNFVTGRVHQEVSGGRPIGDFKVTGAITDCRGEIYMVDYNAGAIALHHPFSFPPMSQNVLNASKISLWNVCLEIHTGRYFSAWLGNFYILIVPLSGLAAVVLVISGYMLWRRKYRGKKE